MFFRLDRPPNSRADVRRRYLSLRVLFPIDIQISNRRVQPPNPRSTSLRSFCVAKANYYCCLSFQCRSITRAALRSGRGSWDLRCIWYAKNRRFSSHIVSARSGSRLISPPWVIICRRSPLRVSEASQPSPPGCPFRTSPLSLLSIPSAVTTSLYPSIHSAQRYRRWSRQNSESMFARSGTLHKPACHHL